MKKTEGFRYSYARLSTLRDGQPSSSDKWFAVPIGDQAHESWRIPNAAILFQLELKVGDTVLIQYRTGDKFCQVITPEHAYLWGSE